MARPGGNPDIREISKKSTGPTSELGKFRSSLNKFTGHDSNPWRSKRIPKQVTELFTWYKALTKDDKEFLFEMKGIYQVLKANLVNSSFTEKILSGEKLTRTELEQFKLMVDIMDKAHKIKYGEKKININADLKDIRDVMFQDDNRRDKRD